MSFLDLLIGRKKQKKEVFFDKKPEIDEVREHINNNAPERIPPPPKPPQEQVLVSQQYGVSVQQAIKEEVAQAQPQKTVVVREEPIITVARELNEIKYMLDDLKNAMHDDHHRMLKEFEYLPKRDEFTRTLDEKLSALNAKKEEVEKEIETTELQKEIINALRDGPLSAAEIADKLQKSRTWVSLQVSQLVTIGLLEHKRDGKHVKYALPEKKQKTSENNALSQQK